jgi:hypothetical protein
MAKEPKRPRRAMPKRVDSIYQLREFIIYHDRIYSDGGTTVKRLKAHYSSIVSRLKKRLNADPENLSEEIRHVVAMFDSRSKAIGSGSAPRTYSPPGLFRRSSRPTSER